MRNEEKLQNDVENGTADLSPDSRAYQKVFDALSREPEIYLPNDFADRVTQMVSHQRTASRLRGPELFFGILALVLTVAILVAAVMLTGFKPQLGFLAELGAFKGVIFFGAAFILFLHAVDKIFLRRKEVN